MAGRGRPEWSARSVRPARPSTTSRPPSAARSAPSWSRSTEKDRRRSGRPHQGALRRSRSRVLLQPRPPRVGIGLVEAGRARENAPTERQESLRHLQPGAGLIAAGGAQERARRNRPLAEQPFERSRLGGVARAAAASAQRQAIEVGRSAYGHG